MEGIIFLALVFFVIWAISYSEAQYKKTSYYQITKNSRWFMGKGSHGEYLIYERLKHLENTGAKFLFNIYLPTKSNRTTELDALLICSKGLFVFESKNYSGWIFGSENNKYWTQTFPNRRGGSHKEKFYNPAMQNASHIYHLRRYIDINTPIWSVIVFSDDCTLKSITINSGNVHVVKGYDLGYVVGHICASAEKNVFTQDKINEVYDSLYPYTQVNYKIRSQHVKDIQKNTPYH